MQSELAVIEFGLCFWLIEQESNAALSLTHDLRSSTAFSSVIILKNVLLLLLSLSSHIFKV